MKLTHDITGDFLTGIGFTKNLLADEGYTFYEKDYEGVSVSVDTDSTGGLEVTIKHPDTDWEFLPIKSLKSILLMDLAFTEGGI